MTRSKLKVNVTEVRKLRKWPISKFSLSPPPMCMQYCKFWYSKTLSSIFFRTDFWNLFSFSVTWPSETSIGYSIFGKRILPVTRNRPAVLYGANFILLVFLCTFLRSVTPRRLTIMINKKLLTSYIQTPKLVLYLNQRPPVSVGSLLEIGTVIGSIGNSDNYRGNTVGTALAEITGR